MKQEHKPAGMTLDQILYTIFRHKWKVLLISMLGIIGTVALPFISPIPYESEAKLYIRYVMENRMPGQGGDGDTRIKSLDSRSDSILNTELEILTSRDLAQQVADSIGPERILAKVGGGTNRIWAASLIQSRLSAEIARESSVVRLTFQHPDIEIVQPVLARLVDLYFKKHVQIHAVGAFDEFLTQQTDQLRSSLSDTEEALRKAKAKLGVISLEDTKKAYSDLSARLEEQIVDADAELAERRAAVKELAKLAPGVSTTSTNTESAASTVAEVPAEQIARYRSACGLLEKLQKKEQELLVTFTPDSTFVKDIRQQISTAAKTKKDLELQNPGLLIVKISATNNIIDGHITDPEVAVTAEMARMRGLESKVQVLTEQLDQLHRKATALDDAEGSITELQRRKGLQESAFTRFSQNLEQSQIDEKLGAGKVSNISTIEEPTPPRKAKSKLFKIMAGLLVGSLGAAFGLAFLIELYLDQSMKRPAEVEAKLGLPLFLDIPRLNRLESFLTKGKQSLELAANNGQSGTESEESKTSSGMEVLAPWQGHPLQTYYEALRDRLITYFEMKNLTHKPKLVAVTSCTEGSGVSTIARGLAASLSETGEGNVLLVNMKAKNGVAHHFHKGELACGLEQALEADKRDTALVQDNLYMVNEGQENQNVPTFLPKRFKQLLPRLRASDFDCIIFDMPPVSQISITPRLARFMDVVLMVVESGRTHVDVVKRASSMLTESNQNVGIVLNKRRDYVPRGLKQES